MVLTIGPHTIQTGVATSAVQYPFQRKGFYARGYHFAFYVRNSKLYWQRSADGITWDGENDITPAGEAPTDGSEFSVWLDRHEEPAHHPHIVYADKDGDSPLYYRRATIAENGDLTWDTNPGEPFVWSEEAVPESLGRSYRYPTICVDDTNGYPIVGYLEYYQATPASSIPWVRASGPPLDGTWNLVNTKQISTTPDASWVTVVVPYQGVYVMALYTRHPSQLIKYDIYDFTGNNWAGEQSAGVLIGADSTKWSVTSQRQGKVASLDPRRVHVAYCDPNARLQYISIDDGGVTGPILIYNSTLAMGPAIATRIFGGDVNHYRTLYVFWTPTSDQPTQDVVAYAKSIDDGANWTNEAGGVDPQDWLNETIGELAGTNIASVYFEEQHHISSPEGYIGLLYTNEGASPEHIRFGALRFADPDEDLLCHAIIRLDNAEELFGKVGITHSIELLGKVAITHSVELFAKFVIGQGSQELFAKFVAGQNSEDLLGKFVSQATQELFGKFAAQDKAELFGKANITHSVELLGKFASQATQELFGKFVVGQDSQELLGLFASQATQELFGKFVVGQDSEELLGRFAAQDKAELLGKVSITHSVELLGKVSITHSVTLKGEFRMSTDDWIIQGVSVEAYIARGIVL